MKKLRFGMLLLISAAALLSWHCSGPAPTDTAEAGGEACCEDQFPILEGKYLGQEPPGPDPQLFAPGIVSTGLYERDLVITPDGNELYF